MYKLKTQIDFECAHRLYNVNTYSEECRQNMHGHSYKVTVIVGRGSLNAAGMVMDFKQLKTSLKHCIEDKYDHSCILKEDDPISEIVSKECKKVHVVDESPTAEWMAKTFFETIQRSIVSIDEEVKLLSVAVQETDHNIAIYEE